MDSFVNSTENQPFGGSQAAGTPSDLSFSGLRGAVERIRDEVQRVIVGQHEMLDLLLAAILANGHVLIEGVPGVAKTLTVKLLTRTLSVGFSRIQFTPDLMPSDVIGTTVYNMKSGEFEYKRGPIFSNMVLIDEINRAPAKTQAALFEVMEERQVTVDGKTYKMSPPFLVFATQNPVEHEGTYRLPEAQLDRFLFQIDVKYPDVNEEARILEGHHKRKNEINFDAIRPVLNGEQLLAYQQLVRSVHVEPHLIQYIAQLVHQTRNSSALFLGGSPRASLAILQGAKALAALAGRDFVTPEDVQRVTYPALKHRIILTPEREMQGATEESIIKLILEKIEVPR